MEKKENFIEDAITESAFGIPESDDCFTDLYLTTSEKEDWDRGLAIQKTIDHLNTVAQMDIAMQLRRIAICLEHKYLK